MLVGVDASNEEWRAMASSEPGGRLGGGGGVGVLRATDSSARRLPTWLSRDLERHRTAVCTQHRLQR